MLWAGPNTFGDAREGSAGMMGWAWGEMLLQKTCQSESLTNLLFLQAQSVKRVCPGEISRGFTGKHWKKTLVHPPMISWHNRTWEWGVMEKVNREVQSLQQRWEHVGARFWRAAPSLRLRQPRAGSNMYLWE